ncbi:hypothetical protein J7337_001131 [Fusarium musae]|uniref:Uncharacterized protein n=1 Tax=Fusarium musae TaxID=1042133 RepID=A0A9P8IW56_9HYPO|nr:hypothetical protein J7337_001131 [Fusarium musae]KAG9507578.1 hypothetical protein J7337_001131 [Fusarium musae]
MQHLHVTAMDIVEFYVSCNPPLLPKGVALIFASVEENEDLGIIEILYEPEIPWFKLIVPRACQREISDWVHSQLAELMESEADAVIRDGDEDDLGTSAIQPDIEVIVEDSHITAYPSLQTTLKDTLSQYDAFRYPAIIKTLPYKTVWRVPESSGVTILQILSNYESLGFVLPLGPSIDSLQALTKCVITYNFQGSLLYIGSSESEQALGFVKQKLYTLASFMDAPLATITHMAFTETSSSATLCYRYMTHTGLSKLTYVDSAGIDQSEDLEYTSIASAASLRMESLNRYRQPVPDCVKYPIPETGELTNWHPEFHPFSGYSYGNKRSGTIPTIEKKRPQQKIHHQESDSVGKNTASTEGHRNLKHVGTDLPKVGKCLEDLRYQARNNKKITNWLCSIESSGDDDHLKLPSLLTGNSEKQDEGTATSLPCDSRRCIEEPRFVNTKDVPLMAANIKDQMPGSDYHASLSQLPLGLEMPENSFEPLGFPNPSVLQSNATKDLMDINDGPIPTPALMDNIPLHDRGTKLQTISEDPVTRSEVTFGKRNLREKTLFDTMRQKAGSGLSWASVASKKKDDNRDDKPTFGFNVPVTFVPGNRSATQRSATPASEVIASLNPIPAEQREEHDRNQSILVEKPKTDPVSPALRIFPGIDMPSAIEVEYSEFLSQVENKLRFYPILTTSGAEANSIPRMSGGRSPWILTGKRVYYEFHCFAGKTPEVIVQVDADTFGHQYFPPTTEVSKTFVHCTRRAWDIKFSVSRMYMEGMADDMEEFAASLVRSLSIETNEMGELVISTEPKSISNLTVDRVRICHEARYRNGGRGPSCLKVIMIRRVEKLPGIPRGTYRGQSVPVTAPANGRPGQWFETSISSVQAEEIFQENIGLEFGDKTHWTPEILHRQGVFRAISEPALQMVRKMDHVGDSNSNGQGPRSDQQSYSAAQDSKARQKGKYFW